MFALAINLVNKKKGLKKTMKKLEETWIKKQKVLYKWARIFGNKPAVKFKITKHKSNQ